MNTPRYLVALASMLLWVSGCGPTVVHKLSFNPEEPLRLAVLPFHFQTESQDISEYAPPTGNLLIDSINPLASVPTGSPTQLMRSFVHNELQSTRFELLSPFLVETALAHSGLTDENGAFRSAEIQKLEPSAVCSKLLTCDAVLYGTVYEWDRDYYGVESVNSVDVEVIIRSARNGKELYRARAKDSDRRGISGGPTGFSDLVLEPIRGLDASIIERLAIKTVGHLVDPLRTQKRSKDTAPPAVYAVATDYHSGTLPRDEPLLVLLYGSPGLRASFSIGEIVKGVPMIEKGTGHYVGEYFPLPEDTFEDETVSVHLVDDSGRSATTPLPQVKLSLR